jgi:nucleotide-binding universal stress UspA family protein
LGCCSIQTILLTIAQDPPPLAAARRAAALALATGARIVLLHVVSPDAAPLDWDGQQRGLAPFLEGVTLQPLLRRGPAAREILAVAREERADLIVMTRHGRWQSASELGFPRFLLHSALCRVLLDADCPVWIEPEADAPASIEHVLCGVASSVHDRETIVHAAGMAAALGAGLGLFRNSVSAAITVPGQQERSAAWQRDVCAAVRTDLEALRSELGVPADIRVGVGGFALALLRETADLIALRRTSRDWGRDETLQPLVRGALVPVLVYPGDKRPVMARPANRAPLSRLAGPLLAVLVLLAGIWMIHATFVRMRQPDCVLEPYRCAVRENMMNSTKDRLGQTQPRADPRMGPFKDDPPEAASHPQQ